MTLGRGEIVIAPPPSSPDRRPENGGRKRKSLAAGSHISIEAGGGPVAFTTLRVHELKSIL